MKTKCARSLIRAACVLSAMALPGVVAAADEIVEYEIDRSVKVELAPAEAQERWKDDRFGLFIHWGPISQMGKQLSHSRNSPSHRPGGGPYKVAPIEPEVYDVQYKTFNPTAYDPDAIVKLAQRAGMRYLVFTAKHHDGFSMFDSAVTDYDIMKTPYGKDLLKELEQACRRNHFNFGIYFSPRDWHHPDCDSENHHDRYIAFYKAQMEEMLTRYGSIYEIFFDGLGPGNWGNTAAEVVQRIRALQPNAMVNDRGGVVGDFYTPEHTISYFNRQQLWQTCHTTTGQWGYNPDVRAKRLPLLMELLLYTWGADGNMLLNIGPRGDGSLNPEEVERLEQLAAWWAVHGETSIRGSRGGPYLPGPWGVATCKDRRVFLHIFRWPAQGSLSLPALPGRIPQAAQLLAGGELTFTRTKGGFDIRVDPKHREPIVTTVEVTFDGDVRKVAPLPVQQSLTWNARLTASHAPDDLRNIVDRDAATYWHAKLRKGEEAFWIEATFDAPKTIGSVVLGRGDEWTPRQNPALQVPDGKGGWKTAFTWKPKWAPVVFLDPPTITDKVRLRVTGATTYHLAEFELYPLQ